MQSPPTYLDAHFYQNKNYANLDIEKRNNELDLDVPFEGVCNELRTGKGTGGWCGCFVGFPVINMPRMMPCVSTIPPKPSDRIHHRSFLSLSLFLTPTNFPPALTYLPLPLYLSVSLRVLLRSWEYTEAIRNSIRSPWRDTAVYWTGPRHGGASHFLPREILVREERNAVYPCHDSHRWIRTEIKGTGSFYFYFHHSPPRVIYDVWSSILELRSRYWSSSRSNLFCRKQMIFFF